MGQTTKTLKILVTGANGQLGSEIQKLSGQYPGFVFAYTDIDSLDITNDVALEDCIDSFVPDFVVNCAAYTAVDRAEQEEDKAMLLNSIAPSLLGIMASKYGFKLIHVSTDYVFNGHAFVPYGEDFPTSPNSAYGRSKLLGEEKLRGNENAMIIRTSWLYSAYGHNFVKTIINKGRTNPELRVVFDQVGTPTWANDLARAILDIISSEKFIPEIFHYSNEGVCSWYDFAKEIIVLSGIQCKVTPVFSNEYQTAASRPPYSVLSKAKIKRLYGIEIPYWKESLAKCLEIINQSK